MTKYRWISKYRRAYLEHRDIMEQHIGRRLKPNEVVHHRNGNGSDNRLENLELHTRSNHASFHHKKAELIELTCSYCGEIYLMKKYRYDYKISKGIKVLFCSRLCHNKTKKPPIYRGKKTSMEVNNAM